MSDGSERLGWLDAAKGVGIVLVVIAHVWTSGVVRDGIYAFHMPLFFLLAGYVASPRPMGIFLKRQWSSLAVPYILFLLFLMAADPIIEHLRGHRPIFRDWGNWLRALLLGGSELRGPFTIFWFVPCLLLARVVQNALSSFWADPRDWRWLVAMAVFLSFGFWIGAASDFSPLGLLSVPVAVVFLWLGSLWRVLDPQLRLVPVLALLCLALLAFLPLKPLNMKLGDYGETVWPLAMALILSLGIAGASRFMDWAWLRALGRMSLVIMFLHVAVIHYARPYLPSYAIILLAIGLPVIAYLLLQHVSWGRKYFLGKPERAESLRGDFRVAG